MHTYVHINNNDNTTNNNNNNDDINNNNNNNKEIKQEIHICIQACGPIRALRPPRLPRRGRLNDANILIDYC